MRLLLIEDDALLGDGIKSGLEQGGDVVDWVHDGISGAAALQNDRFDALILDLGLPRHDGMAVLRGLRRADSDLPVLILTARDSVADRVAGLDAGADDYLVKPFDLDELAARLRAIVRRRAGRAAPLSRHGDLVLDPATRTIRLAGEPVDLGTREFAILQMLLDNAGQVLSRERLEASLYGWNEGVESNTVEVFVHHLRRKLGRDLIRTVRGVGYYIPRHAA